MLVGLLIGETGSLNNTFLSDARQPEVDFLNSSAVILNKFLSKSSL